MEKPEKLKFGSECGQSYCNMCRKSILSSGGYFGKQFINDMDNLVYFYCFTCYPKALEIYLYELKISDYKKERK